MKLTPLDIRKQEFKKTMRGFDPEEVEAFLSMVADEMELLIRERNQINDELIKLRTQLKDYQRVEHTLRETLVKAQNTVEESRANSRREAEIIIHEAELQAEHILKEAREELMELRHEVSLIKTQKESFAKRLRHLLQSQIELLEVMEMEDSNFEEPMTPGPRRRGRMPRREVPSEEREGGGEPRPAEPPKGAREEPRIVRGQDELERPARFNLKQDVREEGPSEPEQEKKPHTGKGSGPLSDQIIV